MRIFPTITKAQPFQAPDKPFWKSAGDTAKYNFFSIAASIIGVWRSWNDYANTFKTIGTLPDRIPVQWQNPGWPWIDPAKDAKGAEIELKMKITNRRTACSRARARLG
jgi:capsid protein